MSTTQLERRATSASTEVRPQSEQTPSAAGAPEKRPYRFRTHFLVAPAEQLRTSLMTTLVVAGLLLMLNVALLQTTRITTAAITDDTPALAPSLIRADQTRAAVTLGCSVVFLLGFGVLRVLETHRTFGAAYNVTQRLEELARGKLRTRVRLRRHDRLQDVAQAVNAVAMSLEERERDEASRLESLAAMASAADAASRTHEIARGLRALIDEKAGRTR